jgi:hypothetical protein
VGAGEPNGLAVGDGADAKAGVVAPKLGVDGVVGAGDTVVGRVAACNAIF